MCSFYPLTMKSCTCQIFLFGTSIKGTGHLSSFTFHYLINTDVASHLVLVHSEDPKICSFFQKLGCQVSGEGKILSL